MATQDIDTNRRKRARNGEQGSKASRDRLKQVTTLALGGALLVRGLRRRSLRGFATAAIGGWLVARTLGGSGRTREALQSRLWSGDESGQTPERAAFTRSITIGRPAEELYEVWRDPDLFSSIMGHFAEVTAVGGDTYRWRAEGPRDWDVSWETRIVQEEPGEFIRWETPGDAMVPNEGAVHFEDAPGDRGTKVTLSINFDPPGGSVGTAALERLDVLPETVVGEALSRFKSLAESGEIPTLEQNPSTRGKGDLV